MELGSLAVIVAFAPCAYFSLKSLHRLEIKVDEALDCIKKSEADVIAEQSNDCSNNDTGSSQSPI